MRACLLTVRTLRGSRYSWWSGNSRLIDLSGKLLGAHVVHTSLIFLWAGSMTFFEVAHIIYSKPCFEQGFILIPHLSTLAYSTGPSADTIDSYSFFIVGVLHLICSGVIGIGGIYHSIPGPIRLEETIHAYIFGYAWQDRTRITSILGAHFKERRLFGFITSVCEIHFYSFLCVSFRPQYVLVFQSYLFVILQVVATINLLSN